jgi:hypothetical protein
MSLVGECALVGQAIQRAAALVSPQAPTSGGVGLGDIEGAARSANATARMTNGSSGVLIAVHRRFAVDNAAALSASGYADSALQARMATAAALTHAGARRLTAIAARAQATLQAGAGATSPAAQRVILTALRAQLVNAAEVVDSVSQHGADVAGDVRALQYELPSSPPGLEPQLPTGPIVWCLRPKGTFGFYRCSILYSDLGVGTYWSPTDDTGGSLP